jgi:voltage-gated potassium channel
VSENKQTGPFSLSPNQVRLARAALLIVAIMAFGTLGYHLLEGWPLLDALYMTVISMTTVGYGETRQLSPSGRIFTMLLLIGSIGTGGYAVSTLASFVVEGEFQRVLRGRRMDRRISNLRDHFILCGSGPTGKYVAEELYKTKTPFVVIEQDPDAIDQLLHIGDVLHLQGDATQDDTLLAAGIKRAKGLIAVLGEDRDNVFIVLGARSLNPHLRIVARVIDEENTEKLRKAGADEIVSANAIGGLRLASVMLRPTVVDFLDQMLRAPDHTLRVEQIEVDQVPALVGKNLKQIDVGRRTGLLVVALKPEKGGYRFNPGAETILHRGDVLIVIGTPEQIDKFKQM